MKNAALHLTDLRLLRDFFAPEKDLYVLDKGKRVTGMAGGEEVHVNHDDFDRNGSACIMDVCEKELSISINNTEGKESWLRFFYINNPDGSMRWFYPSGGDEASHLELYNAGGLKAGIYKAITRMAWRTGTQQLLASGSFRVQQILVESVKKKYGIQEGETPSFFTGTRGATRKMVIELHRGRSSAGFIKAAFTPEARRLLENEYNMVTTLGKYDFTSLSIPKVSGRINGHTRLSNIKPAVIIPAGRITAIHIRALAELYAMSHERKAVTDTAIWQSILTNMDFLTQELVFINQLDREKVKNLVGLLRQLYKTVPTGLSVPVSLSHGDFTPWNMYCDEKRLYVYDWELASNGIPLFFDLFHFTYQSVILQQRKAYAEVKENISLWMQQALVQQLVKKYRVNTGLHHALYLLFNVSHYLRQYLCEKEPLLQSTWMMEAWTRAIADYLVSVPGVGNRP